MDPIQLQDPKIKDESASVSRLSRNQGCLPPLDFGEHGLTRYVEQQGLIAYDELSLLYHNQALRQGDDLGDQQQDFDSLLAYCWRQSTQQPTQWAFLEQLTAGLTLQHLGSGPVALSKADQRQLDNHPLFSESLVWPFTRWAMSRLTTQNQGLSPSYLLTHFGELSLDSLRRRAQRNLVALALVDDGELAPGFQGQLARAALGFALDQLCPRLQQWHKLDQHEQNALVVLVYATSLYCPPVYSLMLQLLWQTNGQGELLRQIQHDLPWLTGQDELLKAWRVFLNQGQLTPLAQNLVPLLGTQSREEPWERLRRLTEHHQDLLDHLLVLAEHHQPELRALANLKDSQRVRQHLDRVAHTLDVTLPSLGKRVPDGVAKLRKKLQPENLVPLLDQVQGQAAVSKLLVERLLSDPEAGRHLLAEAMEWAESIALVPDLNAMANEPERLIEYAERRKASMDQLADRLSHLSESHSDALAVAQSSLSQLAEQNDPTLEQLQAEKHCLEKRLINLEQQQQQLKAHLQQAERRNQELHQALDSDLLSEEDVDVQSSANRLLRGEGRCLDAARVASQRFPHLVILPSALASATHCVYPNGNRVYEALTVLAQAVKSRWDAEGIRNALVGPTGIELLDEQQSTGGKFQWLGARQFGGGELVCRHHLSFGSNLDPERACHLFFDISDTGITVAYIGSAKHG